MSIYQNLYDIEDSRTGGKSCTLNCYLEDYIANHSNESDPKTAILKALFETDKDLRLITDLKAKIDKNQISNIIIRYKDIYKLKETDIVIPFIVYSISGKAAIIHDDYITSKAMYYILSDEPNCLVENRKNTICLAADLNPSECAKYFSSLKNNSNVIQKEIDKHYFESIEKTIEIVKERSEKIIKSIENYSHNKEVKRLSFIEGKIIETYFLKKFIYIQYMLDKDALKNKHQGDIKKHRLEAKLLSDGVRFIPYQKMWEYTDKK